MQLTIKTIKGTTFSLDAAPSTTVGDLKAALEAAQGPGMPKDHIKLVYKGKVLEDNSKALSEYSVNASGFLVVFVQKGLAAKPAAATGGTSATTSAAAKADASSDMQVDASGAAAAPAAQEGPSSASVEGQSSGPPELHEPLEVVTFGELLLPATGHDDSTSHDDFYDDFEAVYRRRSRSRRDDCTEPVYRRAADMRPGEVYPGTWRGIDIAAELYLPHGASEAFPAHDMYMFSTWRHPNLVRIIGYCHEPQLLLMEHDSTAFLAYGRERDRRPMDSLEAENVGSQTLRSRYDLTWEMRLQMLHDVAQGMSYLHSHGQIHGELCSNNLLVAADGKVKVGRYYYYGVTGPAPGNVKATRMQETAWVAPEVLCDSNITPASDVYSFAIIMYKLLTFRTPFHEYSQAKVPIKELAAHGIRPEIPTYERLWYNTSKVCLSNYIRLMQDCWQQDPRQRPSFDTVARRLKAMQHWFLACSNALHISGATVLPNIVNCSRKPSLVQQTLGPRIVAHGDTAAEEAAGTAPQATSSGETQPLPLESPGQEGGSRVKISSIKPANIIRDDHIIAYGELHLYEVIKEGSEGKVWRGRWCGVDIAAGEYSVLSSVLLGGQGQGTTWTTEIQRAQNALLTEVANQGMLTHPNLVRFCGVCLDPPRVVMELHRKDSVYKMLECARAAVNQNWTNKCSDHLSWKGRLQMLLDVACGIVYSVQGNLRSLNLIVTENGRVKIDGNGFEGRSLYGYSGYSGMYTSCSAYGSSFHSFEDRSKEPIRVDRVTYPRWMAPELLGSSCKSAAGDIYSFGIIMYELLTFKIPFEDCTKETVMFKVLEGDRPEIPSFDELPPNTSRICLANYIQLMQDCWQQDPQQRPSCTTVIRRLKAMQRWFLACSNALQISNSSKAVLVPPALSSFDEPHRGEAATLAAAPAAGHAMQAATSNAAHGAVGVGLTKGPAGCLPQHQQPLQEHSEGDHKTSGDCGAVFDGGAGKLEATVAPRTLPAGDNTALAAQQQGHEAWYDSGSSSADGRSLESRGIPAPLHIAVDEASQAASPLALRRADGTVITVADAAAQLAAGAAALELLQPTLSSPLQQLLLLWAVFLAREAAVTLEGNVGDPAACTGTGTQPGVQLPGAAAADSSSTVIAEAGAALDRLSRLQHALEGHQVSVWGLLWLQLQLVCSCRRLQQLLRQGAFECAAAVQEGPVEQQMLVLAAAAIAALSCVLALLVSAAGTKEGKLLVLAAVPVLLAVHLWRSRWSINRRTQQHPAPGTQSRLRGSTQQQGFAVFNCCADLPGRLWVDRSPDAAASTMCYSAFACSEVASAGTDAALPEQQQTGLLLCVLPQPYCEQLGGQLRQGCLAADRNSDTAPVQDQGNGQQHPQGQHSGIEDAAADPSSNAVQLQQHPVLSWGCFGEELKPSAALHGALQPLQAAMHQQQAAQQGAARRLLVSVSWVCLDPPMMLQGASSGSTLASWLLQQQQQQQRHALAGGVDRLQQQLPAQQHQQLQQQAHAEWTPPFPSAEWQQVVGWLSDVVAALQLLHQHGVVHGGVHAGSVHLLGSNRGGMSAQLSLAEPWFRGVTVVPAVDPALSAPEVLGMVPVSSSSSSRDLLTANTSDKRLFTDVYGVGMLMWQLATGWVPQQAVGPAEAQAEVSWCADMVDRCGTTFPGAADAVAAGKTGWSDNWDSSSSAAAAAGYQDARHGYLPSTADSWLPQGYRELMYRCCHPKAHNRPSLQEMQQALQQLARGCAA